MVRPSIYLDYNATAPLRPQARAAIEAALAETGNPSSVHGPGRAARRRVEEARAAVGALAGMPADAVTFTSGATEANNQALRAAEAAGYRCLASAVEHESVINQPGVETVPVDAGGAIDLDALAALAKADGPPIALALMAANNETGAVQPVAEAAAIVHAAGGLVHCDAVQAAGRLPLDSLAGQVDSLSISAHKIGGPMGVGALVAGCGFPAAPLLFGGAQEDRRRAGTENVPGIAGFGAAAGAALSGLGDLPRLAALRDGLEAAMAESAPEIAVLAKDRPRIANTACVATPGLPAETQVMALDLAGIAIGAGSACSSGKVGASHVLRAMGLEDELARCAIRVSLGPETADGDIAAFLEAWKALHTRHARRAA